MSTPESTAAVSHDRAKSKNIGALRGLLPFFAPYKLMSFAALAALIFTALISLALPLAVRGLIDGFNQSIEQLDRYFIISIIIAGALAIGSAIRYALVTRLGERVVSDIRRATYDKMISMSPEFFERMLTGEILSRITTDTTLGAIGHRLLPILCHAQRDYILRRNGLIIMDCAEINGISIVNSAVRPAADIFLIGESPCVLQIKPR